MRGTTIVVVSGLMLACASPSGRETTLFGEASTASGSTSSPDGSTSAAASKSADAGESSTDVPGTGSSTGADEPAFGCDLPPASPTLQPEYWLHPSAPMAGQTLTVALAAPAVEPADAPPLVAELINAAGTHEVTDYTVVGGETLYYISLGGLQAGENCVVIRNGDAVELALEVMASDPGEGVPRGNGVWKVSTNHQWRCDEQPTYGNLLHVRVLDEHGEPIEGAAVGVGFTDDTVFPVGPDEAGDFDSSMHPKTMTTNAEGEAEYSTPWGEGIRSPIDSKPGLAVYRVWVEGGASDVATEISTGLWEATYDGCNYCNAFAINTWGHWSYTVEFRRTPDATEVCDVGTDHEGQQACPFTHFFHDPAKPGCVLVAPET